MSTAAPADPTVRPAPGVPRPYRFPTFTRTVLDNGLAVIRCHLPGRQVVSARLVMEGGITREPPAQAGIATLMARMVTEGTERRSAGDFADAAEALGADISVDAGWDSLQASLSVPVSRLEAAFDLLAEAVLHPTFPAADVERLRLERLNDIKQELADPTQRAQIAFVEAVYTPESPYARQPGGSAETVAALGRDDLVAHYQRSATPMGATLIVAGDLEGVDTDRIAESLFKDWSGPAPATVVPQVAEAITGTSITLVARPGSAQSVVAMGHVGARRLIPDYYPTVLMATVLGGLFTSRLNLKLREEKGYTYGARAGFDFRRQPGPFGSTFSAATAVSIPALTEALTEVRRMHAGGDGAVTQAELSFAQDYLVGIYPLAFETPDAISTAITRWVVYGLPDDYFETYRPSLQAVTVDEATEAAARRLHPDRMAIIVVGDPDLAGPLGDVGAGPVTIVEDPLTDD
ncbi:MAG TPA: pitrilysin family protein [Actinomycetota bacterium]|nr:pitrilysin family protein [Actinomycetota bacterium]